MTKPKLRRVLVFTALLAALSIPPAQAAGGSIRVRERLGSPPRLERLELIAWNFLLGLFEKYRGQLDPNGMTAPADGGH